MDQKELEKRAEQTLRKADTYRVPVEITALAHHLKLTTAAMALEDNVSGMLVVKKDRGAIGYNSTHASVRQRFTIAHEIAHFILHVKKNQQPQLFIDHYVAYRREGHSETGNDHQEVEANQLGAALLMPENLVLQEIKRLDLDLEDDEALNMLAKKFRVSTIAMTNRLINLGLLR